MRNFKLLPVLLIASMSVCAADFSFGLWGDMPYGKNNDAQQTRAVIDSINASDVALTIFDGDFKDGSSVCSDAVYKDALVTFNNMRQPLIYAVGDNEWTDCHRTNNGGYNASERLSLIRRTFFASSQSLGQQKTKLVQQGKPGDKFSENTRLTHEGVVFMGLNVPGSNNNWVMSAKECTYKSARTLADCEATNEEYIERDGKNIEWLKMGFAAAKSQSALGVVVVIQGNPGFDLPETHEDESQLAQYAGYRNFMSALTTETEQFAGQVLLVHGDDHFYKVDKPLYAPNRLLHNLTRVQTFGSPSNHWVRVDVNASQPEVFTIRPVIVKPVK